MDEEELLRQQYRQLYSELSHAVTLLDRLNKSVDNTRLMTKDKIKIDDNIPSEEKIDKIEGTITKVMSDISTNVLPLVKVRM